MTTIPVSATKAHFCKQANSNETYELVPDDNVILFNPPLVGHMERSVWEVDSQNSDDKYIVIFGGVTDFITEQFGATKSGTVYKRGGNEQCTNVNAEMRLCGAKQKCVGVQFIMYK